MDARKQRLRAFSVLKIIGLASGALMLAGCGGDESDAAAAPIPETSPPPTSPPPTSPPPAGTPNRAPTISGTPLASVMQGGSYTFTPSAADADGNTLAFSVQNRPAWATFEATTGRLSGTPSPADVGTHGNIRITVSDGVASANLPTFSIQVVATATGSATLSWTPPTQNTDGSPLTNLAGYRVYWGTVQGDYTNSVTLNNPGLSSYVVDQLTPATWYFALTAINAMGVESSFSNGGSKQVL